jgi:hypothetical protein
LIGKRLPEVREQFVDARARVLVDADEHVLEVREWVHPVRLTRRDE